MSTLIERLQQKEHTLDDPQFIAKGRVIKLSGFIIEATGVQVPIGSLCYIVVDEQHKIELEVVGFNKEISYLMPLQDTSGIEPGAPIIPSLHAQKVLVGEGLLGRVIDGTGQPIDGKGPLSGAYYKQIHAKPHNPLEREICKEPLDVGIRAINALFTVAKGQRMGLFAGSGVGKSVLLGMMTQYTEADAVVIALIGERGREVKEFIQHTLGPASLQKAVVITSPADSPPLQRINGAEIAMTIAEGLQEQGKNVLFIMDSLTRYAQALREVALSLGEPPATKGYPPSVFAKIPKFVERAGMGKANEGSITGFYTVLAEGDDKHDPIVDAARAILDGHILLSRHLAESGHYPAIDIGASISRLMNHIVPEQHVQLATRFRQLYSVYEENKDLILVGAYQTGKNAELDTAVQKMPKINSFLQQTISQKATYTESVGILNQIMMTNEVTTHDNG